jgi:hypothetical protein
MKLHLLGTLLATLTLPVLGAAPTAANEKSEKDVKRADIVRDTQGKSAIVAAAIYQHKKSQARFVILRDIPVEHAKEDAHLFTEVQTIQQALKITTLLKEMAHVPFNLLLSSLPNDKGMVNQLIDTNIDSAIKKTNPEALTPELSWLAGYVISSEFLNSPEIKALRAGQHPPDKPMHTKKWGKIINQLTQGVPSERAFQRIKQQYNALFSALKQHTSTKFLPTPKTIAQMLNYIQALLKNPKDFFTKPISAVTLYKQCAGIIGAFLECKYRQKEHTLLNRPTATIIIEHHCNLFSQTLANRPDFTLLAVYSEGTDSSALLSLFETASTPLSSANIAAALDFINPNAKLCRNITTCAALATRKDSDYCTPECHDAHVDLLQAKSEVDTKSSTATQHVCARCAKAGEKYQRCARCKIAYYCSEACKEEHWPAHKTICLPPSSPAAPIKK